MIFQLLILEADVALLDKINWLKLPSATDVRGVLTSIESEIDAPFMINRVFYMHHIVSERGGHAHMDTDQIVIAVAGSFKLSLSDGVDKRTFVLDDAKIGLYIPRQIFINISDISPNAVCLVLASSHYDIKRSIRSWDDYLKYLGCEKKQ
ncbi:FdtA/QdtA family cupin domain-containing protein [Candidatus Saganbacteria bacterium]|nr:FdtA/QdtA family cupin domain-containing protein [Candidatus Saganbacteria bacterium]